MLARARHAERDDLFPWAARCNGKGLCPGCSKLCKASRDAALTVRALEPERSREALGFLAAVCALAGA